MMDRWTADLMGRYGQAVEVIRAGERIPARAFVRPIVSKQEGRQHMPTPLGLRGEDRFLYLGEPQVEVSAGADRVVWQDRKFEVLSAQPIYVGEQLSHWRAVLLPADKEEA